MKILHVDIGSVEGHEDVYDLIQRLSDTLDKVGPDRSFPTHVHSCFLRLALRSRPKHGPQSQSQSDTTTSTSASAAAASQSAALDSIAQGENVHADAGFASLLVFFSLIVVRSFVVDLFGPRSQIWSGVESAASPLSSMPATVSGRLLDVWNVC
jgi:hypothetical protein